MPAAAARAAVPAGSASSSKLGANEIIQNLKAFLLRTHRQRIGGLARQAERSLPKGSEHRLETALNGRQPCPFARLDASLQSSRWRLMRVKFSVVGHTQCTVRRPPSPRAT